MDDEREEELSSLKAIFPEIVDGQGQYSFSMEIPVKPVEPVNVIFGQDVTQISHLPSLKLDVKLPNDYPPESPPQVRITSCWITASKVSDLERDSVSMWEEYGHTPMLFDYIDQLLQGADSVWGMMDESNSISLDPCLKLVVTNFDKLASKAAFDHETFNCGVCLDPRKGSDCHRLRRCGHVFCIDCLRSAYDTAIAEGDVARVNCLYPDCGVERDPITKRALQAAPVLGPDELLDIPIAQTAVERYVKLARKKRFQSFPKTVYCPRKWCQGIARAKKYPAQPISDMTAADLEPENILSAADAEPKDLRNNEDRLRICEDCGLAFCRVCLATWHGDYVLRCWPRTADELTEDEKASYSYLLKYTSPCPSCDFAIQKSMGCNHITCFNCKNHFCYLCSAWLDPGDPYKHFAKKGTPCYQRLWDMEGGDPGDAAAQVEFLGARGAELAAALAEEEELAQARTP